ncbi:hypothetical protein LZ554_007249 [Drepanopeziza brunnea f. sp. 'monogermtubi']|nr:hypothetical protein LZ554_007249 [Drepanopeziza brunnea f. sp. 'monogermtubi']
MAEPVVETARGDAATHRRDPLLPSPDRESTDSGGRESLDAFLAGDELLGDRTAAAREFPVVAGETRWWKIYGLHFLFMWNIRTFEYVSIVLVASAFPDSLTAASIRGIVSTLSSILFASSVGSWIDKSSNRTTPLRISIIVNHGAVVLTYLAWILWPAVAEHDSTFARNTLFVAILVLDVLQVLSATGNSLSLSRDCIPVLADSTSPHTLTQVNAVIARVNLFCKIASPSLLPIIVNAYSRSTWISIVALSTVVVWTAEMYCLKHVSRENPRLTLSKDQDFPLDGALEEEVYGREASFILKAHSLLYQGPAFRLRHFFSIAVWPASITMAFLYLTVLVYSAALITYLLHSGVPLSVVTLARTSGSLMGFVATFTTPVVSRYLTGKLPAGSANGTISRKLSSWGITGQFLALIPVVFVLWNLSPSAPTESSSSTTSTASQVSIRTMFTLFGFLSLSRLFHWTYSLMEQEIEQSEVPASQRSTFSGTGESLRSCFDLAHWTATVVWSRPEEFKGLAGASLKDATTAAGLAAALIIIWVSLVNIRGPGLFYEPQPSLELLPGDDSKFLHQAMNVEFPAPIDYEPIREVCTRHPSNFRPGLVFTCEEQHGGVGMVRNQILKCIRYAIHGGAAIVIPSMAKRNPGNISDIETNNEVPLENMFDREAFIDHLTKACPGMRLYHRVEDFPSYNQRAGEPLSLRGDQFEPDHPRTGLQQPQKWRRFFDTWLEQQQVKISSKAPVHVKIEQTYIEYPVHHDSTAFAAEFGKILSFRRDTQALAARVLYQLKQQFSLPIDPRKAINPDAFYGAHLRLERDAVWAWDPEHWRFSRMQDQFEQQFQNIMRTNLRIVYVASGNQTVVDLFAQYLDKRIAEESAVASDGSPARNVTVVTKYDLLTGHDRDRLEAMGFDQQGLIDFLIMFKASAFMGVAHSSFPWTVALRRHELSQYPEYANLGSDILQDEYSTIMGTRADYPYVDPFEFGLWP